MKPKSCVGMREGAAAADKKTAPSGDDAEKRRERPTVPNRVREEKRVRFGPFSETNSVSHLRAFRAEPALNQAICLAL